MIINEERRQRKSLFCWCEKIDKYFLFYVFLPELENYMVKKEHMKRLLTKIIKIIYKNNRYYLQRILFTYM